MREPRDPLLKVVLIACYRKETFYTVLSLCENASPLRDKPKENPRGGAHGVRWMVESTLGVHDKESATALVPRLYDNDPSAGSPTETLLRLLLPLNDQV